MTLAASTLIIFLSACGQGSDVNPPTEPAEPIASPAGGAGGSAVASGNPAFTGLWASQASWCANTSATTDQVPVRITTTEYRGYENACAIGDIAETDAGWETRLQCEAEGQRSEERARFAVSDETMTISWLDRDTPPTTLVRCPEIAEAAAPPV